MKKFFNWLHSVSLSMVTIQPARESTGLIATNFWIAFFIALVVIIAYFPSLNNAFVNWDDTENFLSNPFFRGLGSGNIRWAFATYRRGAYQPFGWLLFSLQYLAFGVQPWGFHLTSILLHSINCMLLYFLTVEIMVFFNDGGSDRDSRIVSYSALFAVLVYAVHPLRVEVVSWASCQPYIPCASFSMLATLSYLRSLKAVNSRGRLVWDAICFFSLVSSLLSKSVPVGLPIVFCIIDVYANKRGQFAYNSAKSILLKKLHLFAFSAFIIVEAILAKHYNQGLIRLDSLGIIDRIYLVAFSSLFYLFKTCIPLNLLPYYPLPQKINLNSVDFMLSWAGFTLISAAAILSYRRRPAFLSAWACYLVILLPNSGLVGIGQGLGATRVIAADRYSYIASMIWIPIFASQLAALWQFFRYRRVLLVLLSLIITCLILMTWSQCRIWSDSVSLWSHTLAKGGNSALAHYNLGVALESLGRPDLASPHFKAANTILKYQNLPPLK